MIKKFKLYIKKSYFLDKHKNIKYKCRSCKREWTTHNFIDLTCIFCNSDKITEY